MNLIFTQYLQFYKTICLNFKLGEHNIHKCAVAVNACQATKESPCKRLFDTFTETQATTFNKKGRPLYRRPLTRDL